MLALFSLPLLATSLVDGVRIWSAPDHSRLVFDVDGPIKYKSFTLSGPDRLVIDFKQAKLRGKLADPGSDDLFIKGLRYASRNGDDFRVVLDLKANIDPHIFILKPNDQYNYRLVVDLKSQHGKADVAAKPEVRPAESTAESSSPSSAQSTPAVAVAKPKVPKKVHDKNQLRDVVIAIDAGHGGDDPGAIGPRGTREKEVVLKIARKLHDRLNQEPGFKAVMTRHGDYYVGLRQRMAIARRHRADLFVSIHADAFKDPRVRGASVYVLSNHGASSEAARWLADRENAADLVGGVKLEDKDDMLASVLLDLSQTATRQASMVVARTVFEQLRRNGKVHGKGIHQAGFMVLKAPDVPSLLVETAFISNPDEEHKLRKTSHQKKMAEAIMLGIKHYFVQTPPPGTWLASNSPKRHVIVSGETLSEIAQQYRVSLNSLRQTNGIKGNHLNVGQVLKIPRS